MSRKYLTLEQEIIEKCPKAFQELVKWVGTLGGIPDEQNEIIAKTIIINTPRFLYDFFDDKGLIVTIDFVINTEGGSFYWSLPDSDFEYGGDDRIDAEKAAFEKLFEILENKLS